MSNPWDSPNAEPKGDATPEPIYSAVGYALSTWEAMEDSLAGIFQILCGSVAARFAYGEIVGHHSRNKMLSTAAEVAARTDLLTFIEAVGQFSARRNEIAHGRVTEITFNTTPLGCYLMPPGYQTGKSFWNTKRKGVAGGTLFGKYQYTAAQVGDFAAKFLQLRHEADKWAVTLTQPASQTRPAEPGTVET